MKIFGHFNKKFVSSGQFREWYEWMSKRRAITAEQHSILIQKTANTEDFVTPRF